MNDRKKRNIIYLIVFIFIFVMIITVSTYCYFITKDFYYGNFNVEVNTKGVDTLQMKNLVDANLNVNDRNFIKDVGHSISGTSSIDVVLDTTKKETKYCYNVYLSLPDKEIFSYSNYPKSELSLSVYESKRKASYYIYKTFNKFIFDILVNFMYNIIINWLGGCYYGNGIKQKSWTVFQKIW